MDPGLSVADGGLDISLRDASDHLKLGELDLIGPDLYGVNRVRAYYLRGEWITDAQLRFDGEVWCRIFSPEISMGAGPFGS